MDIMDIMDIKDIMDNKDIMDIMDIKHIMDILSNDVIWPKNWDLIKDSHIFFHKKLFENKIAYTVDVVRKYACFFTFRKVR